MTGFTTTRSSPSSTKTNSRRRTPTCVAASPTPFASCMSAVMRSTSRSRSSSNASTSRAFMRSTESPYWRIRESASRRRASRSSSCSSSAHDRARRRVRDRARRRDRARGRARGRPSRGESSRRAMARSISRCRSPGRPPISDLPLASTRRRATRIHAIREVCRSGLSKRYARSMLNRRATAVVPSLLTSATFRRSSRSRDADDMELGEARSGPRARAHHELGAATVVQRVTETRARRPQRVLLLDDAARSLDGVRGSRCGLAPPQTQRRMSRGRLRVDARRAEARSPDVGDRQRSRSIEPTQRAFVIRSSLRPRRSRRAADQGEGDDDDRRRITFVLLTRTGTA